MISTIHIRPSHVMHSSKRDTVNTVTDATLFTENAHNCLNKANGKRFIQRTETFSKKLINPHKAES